MSEATKPGEMEAIVPEEVSVVDKPAVPGASFVTLSKSETPVPDLTVGAALEFLAGKASEFTDVQKAAICDMAIGFMPEEEPIEKSLTKEDVVVIVTGMLGEFEKVQKQAVAEIEKSAAVLAPLVVEKQELSDEEILAKAREIEARSKPDPKLEQLSSTVGALVAQVGVLSKTIGREVLGREI